MKKDPNINNMKVPEILPNFVQRENFECVIQTLRHKIYLLTSTGTKYFQQFILSGQNTELYLRLLSPEHHYFCRLVAMLRLYYQT